MDEEVFAVVGAFRVMAHGDDVFEITFRDYVEVPDLGVADCSAHSKLVAYPRNVGRVAFGAIPLGYDPCKGPYSPFSGFLGRSLSDLEGFQVKLSWVADAFRPMNTVALVATGDSLDVGGFARSWRDGFSYYYDVYWPSEAADWNPIVVNVPATLMAAVIDSIGAVADARSGGVDTAGVVSIAILDRSDGSVFESVVSDSIAGLVVEKVMDAVRSSSEAVSELETFGCQCWLFRNDPATDFSNRVEVYFDGPRFDYHAGEYVGNVRIVNTSGESLPEPVTLVLYVRPPVEVANADGTTCILGFGGDYFDLPSIAAGDTLRTLVRYRNPTDVAIEVKGSVYAGAKHR